MKIGILREEKNPPDRRVPFTPSQCKQIIEEYPDVSLVVQPSPIRCFSDKEYREEGIELQEDLSDCDVLFGVKEVPVQYLIADKTYFYFSHTHKLQPYNQPLIKAILKNRITHIDYECLTYNNGFRIIGFGRYAGLVGAYNGLKTYGERYRIYQLKPAHECRDLNELKEELKKINLGAVKIVLTGSGRVARGANKIMEAAQIKKVEPSEYLNKAFEEAVYCWIDADQYAYRSDHDTFDFQDFFANGQAYTSHFLRFAEVSDLFIAGHFWDQSAPVFFTKEEARLPSFKIRVIADISCDIDGPIPSTIRPSTIADPVYDYDRFTHKELPPYENESAISVMAVDNLPCELPVDASEGFGAVLLEKIIPLVVNGDQDGILERATFTNNRGELMPAYAYMSEYAGVAE